MGVTTYTQEFTTTVAPAKFFKVMMHDSHTLVPKILPHLVKSIDLHGDGAVGSIKQTNFAEGVPFKYMKHKLDHLDADHFVVKYTLFEGDMLDDKVEKIVYEDKLVPSGGGCTFKSTSHYYTKGDFVLTEDKVKEPQEKHIGMYKAVAEYLVANPSACA